MSVSRWLLLLSLASVGLAAAGFVWYSQHVPAQRQAGLKAAEAREYTAAEPALRAALVHDRADVEVLRALVRIYQAQERRGDALDCLAQWLHAAPGAREPLELRLGIYRELGRFDDALADLDRLLGAEPNDPALRRKRPALLYNAGRFAEAEEDCRQCLAEQPGNRAVRRVLAEVRRVRKDFAGAGELLDGLLAEQPDDPPTLVARAHLYDDQGLPDKSVPLYRRVLALDPNRQRSARYDLSLALARGGQTDEARRLMAEVRRMQDAAVLLKDSEGLPNNLPLQVRTARALFDNNDLPRALATLRHVLQVDPAYGPAHALLADLYDRQGQFDLAAEHRRRAGPIP